MVERYGCKRPTAYFGGEIVDNGLTRIDCTHDRQAFDSIIMGIEWHTCLDCGEMLERYLDGNGG